MFLSTGKMIRTLSKNDTTMGIELKGDVLRRLQKELLYITKDIVDVCDKCGATYYLIGGNALGAVRHKGFIPWDDDMDIGMLSKDYPLFIKEFQNTYGDKYWIHDENTPNHPSPITHILLKNSVLRSSEENDNHECGISVEINKVENVPNNPILRYLHGFVCNSVGMLMSCRNYYVNRKFRLSLAAGNRKATCLFRVKIAIGWMTCIVSIPRLNRFAQFCYGLCKNEQTKYVNIPRGRAHYFGDMYLRSDFVKPRKMEFEGFQWNLPTNPDAYLSKLYGDYMTIPPESGRDRHLVCELVFPERT